LSIAVETHGNWRNRLSLVVDKHGDPVRLEDVLLLVVVTVAMSGGRARGTSLLSKLDSGSQRTAVRSTKLLRDLSEAKGAQRTNTARRRRQTNASRSGRAIDRGVHGTGRESIQTA
jgi:hypothetical protein